MAFDLEAGLSDADVERIAEAVVRKLRGARVVHGVPYYWGLLDREAYSERLVVLPERY